MLSANTSAFGLLSSLCVHDLRISRCRVSLVRTGLAHRLLYTIAYSTPPPRCPMPKLQTPCPHQTCFSQFCLHLVNGNSILSFAQVKNLESSLALTFLNPVYQQILSTPTSKSTQNPTSLFYLYKW